MKSLYIRYIRAFLRSDRKNAFAEGAIYALFAFVMSLVLSVILSFTISFGEYIDNRYGFVDGYIPCADDKKIASLTADNRIERYSFADAFAYIDPLTDVTGNITVGTLEDGAAELLGLHLVSGRMPEAADEIVLEQSVYERLASFADDGSINLELTYFTGEKVSRTFKAVGVIADYIADRTKSGEELFTYTEPHKQLPAIICGSSDAPSVRHMLIKVADGIDAAQFISGISSGAVLNSRRIDSDVDKIRLTFNVLAILSFIAGVVFLLGSMKLRRPRLAERSRKLKCGGLENKAVLRFRICSLLPVALVSCFGGALVGVGGAALTVSLLSGLIDYLAFRTSPAAVFGIALAETVFVCITAVLNELPVLSKMPCETGSDNTKHRSIRLARGFFTRHPVLSWSMKAFFHHSGKHASVMLCAFFSTYIMVHLSSTLYMTLEHHSEKTSYDYLLSSPACTTAEPFDNPTGIWAVMDENDAALLASCDEVRAAYGYTRYTVYILDSSLTDGLPFKKLKETFYTSAEVLHELLTKSGYGENDELFTASLVQCSSELFAFLCETADISVSEAAGKGLLVTNGDSPYKSGDTITLTQPGIDYCRKDADITIAADLAPDSIPDRVRFNNTIYICDDTFPLLTDGGRLKYLAVWLNDSNVFSETEARIRRISSLYSSGISAYSKRAANAEVVSETVAIGVNGGLIILIFAIYSMTNICAMTAERIRSHIRTWGVLRAAGVRPHTAAVTHLGETAFTFILGCAPGAGLFYGLIGSEALVGEGINPLFVLLYAAAMILAAYICIRVTVNRFWSIPVRRMLIG